MTMSMMALDHFCIPIQLYKFSSLFCVPLDKTFEEFLSRKVGIITLSDLRANILCQENHFIQVLTNVESHWPCLRFLWFVYAKLHKLLCMASIACVIYVHQRTPHFGPIHFIYSLFLAINYFYFDNSLLLHCMQFALLNKLLAACSLAGMRYILYKNILR